MRRPIQPLAFVLAFLWLAGGSVGCLDEALPSEWELAKNTVERIGERAEDPEADREAFLGAMETVFGTAAQPQWPLGKSDGEGGKILAEAAKTYRKECAHCHGLEGFGDGTSSQFVHPKPWNFAIGVFPRTAPQGGEPELSALVKLLREGIPSAAMPAFGRLGEERLRTVSGHVLFLKRRARFEQALLAAYLEEGVGALEEERLWEIYSEAEAEGL